jgi:ATP:corrinoid adenosyltransferase
MKLRVGETIKEFLVEIKPHKQTKQPTTHGNKKKSTILYENVQWAINQAKWEAAKKYCEKKNMQFIIIDENNIEKLLST